MDLFLQMNIRIFILLFVLLPCDAEEKVNLPAVVGSSVTFPDPVKERGFLIFGSKLIASVSNGAFEIEENIYTNRLQWSSSGHFILSNLQKNDSGVYLIDSKKGTVFNKYYELKLYEPVCVPVVSCVNLSEHSVSLQCSVDKTEQTTLRWFRGEQPVVSGRSGALNFTVQRKDYSSEYKCEAQNPAETRNITVKIRTVCKVSETLPPEDTSKLTTLHYVLIILLILCILLVCVGIIIFKKKFSKGATIGTQGCVESFRKLLSPRPDHSLR